MIEPMRHDPPAPRAGEAIPDPQIRLSTPVSLLVHVEAVLSRPGGHADHRRAPALTGSIHLPELRTEITFRSDDGHGHGNGHAVEHRATAVLVPLRTTMKIPLQQLAQPAPDESDVWALTSAPDLDPPWTEHYAGRLDGAPLTFDRHIRVEGTLNVTFLRQDSGNGSGAQVELAGELRFERPASMRLLFRKPEGSPASRPESETREAALIVAGSRVPIARQTVSRLPCHNPWMSARVIETGGVVCVERPPVAKTEGA